MPERRVVITLNELQIQAFERTVLDNDGESALDFIKKVIKPQVLAALDRSHCKPLFEWGSESRSIAAGPPEPPAR